MLAGVVPPFSTVILPSGDIRMRTLESAALFAARSWEMFCDWLLGERGGEQELTPSLEPLWSDPEGEGGNMTGSEKGLLGSDLILPL